MVIYKTINKINGKWYIGKDMSNNPQYYGSGKLVTQAIAKYGKENFEKIILETCTSKEELSLREKCWIRETNATTDPLSYNLAEGGEGGDLSKFIDYSKRRANDKFAGRQQWYNNLTEEEKRDIVLKQAQSRSKGWYVSKIDDPSDIYVQNMSKWCEENGVDKSMPSNLNNPQNRLFQKQTKGWSIRRADMPLLPPCTSNRHLGKPNPTCKGKTWALVDGKRKWCGK